MELSYNYKQVDVSYRRNFNMITFNYDTGTRLR